MKVRFKRGWVRRYPVLTAGNVYRVLGIENHSLRIVDDAGDPLLFSSKAFEVVDTTMPSEWTAVGANRYPPELSSPSFDFAAYFDGAPGAIRQLQQHVRTRCWAELATVSNRFVRMEQDASLTFYIELDQAGWEVRKVEVFATGRMTYACDRFGSSGATLEDEPGGGDAEHVEVSRETFERLWEAATDIDEIAPDRLDARYPVVSKVRFKRGWAHIYPELTAGNVYRVIDLSGSSVRVIDDVGEPVLFPRRVFEVIDATVPDDWVLEHHDEVLYASPLELTEPRCFFDSYFDDDDVSVRTMLRSKLRWYVHARCRAEIEAMPYPPDRFVRTTTGPSVIVYRELDDHGWEVRKVEVFPDGRITYDETWTGPDDPRVGEAPVDPEIVGEHALVRDSITREEFEAIWARAIDADETLAH